MFDIHCHILFDVDDGSNDFAESQAMLNAARNAGIDNIVCTPHCRGSRFDYQRIVDHYDVLSRFAHSQGFAMALGFEVYWENLIDFGLENASRLCIEDTNLMLLELSVGSMPVNWQRIIYNLQGQGIQPIIAHPERYRAVQNNLDIAFEMKDLGCLLQLSGNFATGGFRSNSKRAALQLLENGLIDYVASDAHCVEDYNDYRKALKIAQKY
ncbi:MAG: CpsB/CapC family capsule biosynthesis tyrosine phosphatase [Gordonibacter sp.]|uniref:tyrosine-protein phosphatase n=2 Tax=Gordonibacter sp. TaxID=1968902 RepID=UPI002FC5EEA8